MSATDPATAALLASEKPPLSPARLALYRARRHPGFLIGGFIVLAFVLVAIFAPWIAPSDPYAQDIANQFAPPLWQPGGSWAHPIGTDGLGRDVLSRVIYGARVSLLVGFLAAGLAAIIGTTIGVIGGYFGGKVDSVVMYVVTTKLALPGLVVALSLISIFKASVPVLIGAIAILFWDRYAVVTRAAAMQLRGSEFVAAARAIGSSHLRIIVVELLPNLMNQVVVVLTLETAVAILVEAALSFLGLGIQPPTPSWGGMVSEARADMFFQPHLIAAPGLAIFILVIAINLFGDGLRDVTAPEGRG
jgi:peptide/nickel transport system permease protein